MTASNNISEIKIGNQITLSIKFSGTTILYNGTGYCKSRKRPIDKIDYLLGDSYYYPIRKVLDSQLKFGYYKFTYDGIDGIYMDVGADDLKNVITNSNIPITVNQKWKEMFESTNPYLAVIEHLNISGVDKFILRLSDKTYIIPCVDEGQRPKQSINDQLLTIDMISNTSVGTIQNLWQQQHKDELYIKVVTQLFLEYIQSTTYNILDMFSDLPSYMKTKYAVEKAESTGDYSLINLTSSNASYFDAFCFMLSLFRREKLLQNPFIKMGHVRKFASIIKYIDSLYVPHPLQNI